MYHGWSFGCRGAGESPGTPKLHAHATNFDAVDKYESIWVKTAGSKASFPHLEIDGYYNH
jgi:hypothetical protein